MALSQTDIYAILNQQSDSAAMLVQVLERESLAIVQGDIKALGQLMALKQERCSTLAALEQHIKTWLNDEELERWIPQQSADVQHQWQQLLACLQQCQTQNDANGLLIERRQSEIEKRLKPADAGTYGASGQNLPQTGSNLQFSV